MKGLKVIFGTNSSSKKYKSDKINIVDIGKEKEITKKMIGFNFLTK